MSAPLSLWSVYHGATDVPSGYLARRFEITHPGEPVATADVMVEPELEPLRARLAARGLACLGRHPEDEPQIVETWL